MLYRAFGHALMSEPALQNKRFKRCVCAVISCSLASDGDIKVAGVFTGVAEWI